MCYEIESGVSMPAPNAGGFPTKFPFVKMFEGDSFFIPCENNRRLQNIRRLVYNHAKRHNILEIQTRIMYDPYGLRVWLVKRGEAQ